MEILTYPFFLRALAGVAIISVAVAIIGVYIMSRRMVFLSGGITHACFGGLGLGYFLGCNPVVMAGVFAVASSLGVQWMSNRHRVREDSAIAVVWALGMALGTLFIFLTPGYVPELNAFLFGNVLTITSGDLWSFGIYTALLLIFFACFFRKIVVCAFDPDFATSPSSACHFYHYSDDCFCSCVHCSYHTSCRCDAPHVDARPATDDFRDFLSQIQVDDASFDCNIGCLLYFRLVARDCN